MTAQPERVPTPSWCSGRKCVAEQGYGYRIVDADDLLAATDA
ncbi:hypothetical protein [Streptomyces sp. NPDC048639]